MFDSMGGTKAELSDIRDSTPAVLCSGRNSAATEPPCGRPVGPCNDSREPQMANSNQRGTNAGDSAPGVNDGPARNAAPDHSKVGRGRVWLWIALSLAILLGILLARPLTTSRDQTTERGGPGAADRPAATPP
jgi:hypothetical protein